MPTLTATSLRSEIVSILHRQGYKVNNGGFVLKKTNREAKRAAHRFAKAERIASNEDFIKNNLPFVQKFLVSGKDLDIDKIEPTILEVESGTQWEILFRWWNLMWWSLPYERAYGRQMRFIIWDKYYKAPIGLIGLQSPILSWSVRDDYLKIPMEDRDYWVNQSLNAQRLGALPPYNYILGGKLVASLMTSEIVRKKFEKKYQGQKTLLMGRRLPARLLFLTTTGAYGKSSVYSRLKFKDEIVAHYIGDSHGSGSFHIPNALYEDLVKFLDKKGYNTERGYGNGPSRKMRLINQALNLLGLENGINHGIRRAVYLFPLVRNLEDVIQEDARPEWIHRNTKNITSFWKERWGKPRTERDKSYLNFNPEKFIKQTMVDLRKYKRYCQVI